MYNQVGQLKFKFNHFITCFTIICFLKLLSLLHSSLILHSRHSLFLDCYNSMFIQQYTLSPSFVGYIGLNLLLLVDIMHTEPYVRHSNCITVFTSGNVLHQQGMNTSSGSSNVLASHSQCIIILLYHDTSFTQKKMHQHVTPCHLTDLMISPPKQGIQIL